VVGGIDSRKLKRHEMDSVSGIACVVDRCAFKVQNSRHTLYARIYQKVNKKRRRTSERGLSLAELKTCPESLEKAKKFKQL